MNIDTNVPLGLREASQDAYKLPGNVVGEHRTLRWLSVADRRSRMRGTHTAVDLLSIFGDGYTEELEAADYCLIKGHLIVNICTARVME